MFAPVFLVLAWTYGTALILDSSWGQVENTLRGEIESYNTIMILGKLVFLSVCAVSLALAFRRAVRATGSP